MNDVESGNLRKWPREPWVLAHQDPQSPEVERLIAALIYLEGHAALVREELQNKQGENRPAWVHKGHSRAGSTYLEIARQLVNAHSQCAYWKLWQAPLADDTVRYRANMRLMFMEGRKAAKRHGEKGAMRMLEAMRPPHDPEIDSRARELMVEVLAKKKTPLTAAKELTATIIKIRRQIEPAKDFVRQGADLLTSRNVKHDDDFAETIEMVTTMLDEEAAHTAQRAAIIKP